MTTALRIAQGRFGRVSLLDMDTPLAPHAHPQCHAIFKVSGADSAFYINDERLPVTDRTAILVNAWEPHYFQSEPDFPRTAYLVLYIEPEWMSSLHSPLHVAAHPRFFPQSCVDIPASLRTRVDHLVASMMSLVPVSQEKLEQELFELMVEVCERFSAWGRRDTLLLSPGGLVQDARIHKALMVIRNNPAQIPDFEALAHSVHLSRAQFFLRFKRSTGLTPAMFVNMQRAELAGQRLAQTAYYGSVGKLADELGFTDPAHFTRFIRNHLCVTPSDYQRAVHLYNDH